MEFYDLYDSTMPQRLIEFLNYLITIKNLSSKTVYNYKSDLKLLLRFLKKVKLRLKEDVSLIDISDIDDDFLRAITLTDMYMYLSYITMERKNGANARARKIASAKSFFKYLESKAKMLDQNPTRELESPKIEKRNPVYLTLEESKQFLNNISGRYKERDLCIAIIFLNCGLRLSELIGISIPNIKDDMLTVVGKGNKERTIYLNNACIEAIDDYLKVRLEPKDDDGKIALFLSNRGKRISEREVQKLLKKYFLEADLTAKKYTAHKLRHTAATLLYKHGNVDIRVLQKILGHESVSTTQIYTHVDEEQLRDAAKLNPLSDFIKK